MLSAIRFLLLFAFLIFTVPQTIFSQVLNVESFRSEAETDTVKNWGGETLFDVSLSKYNDKVFKLGNETNAVYFSGQHRYLFLTSVELINIDGNSVVSNGYFHLRGTFLEARKWSPELFTQFQYNENLGIKERFLAGVSTRYTFLERPGIRGSAVTGFMYEREKWGTDTQPNVVNNYIKSTSSLVVRGQLSPQAQLLVIGYYQARPSRFFSPRITSENQLNLKISTNLTFRVKFTLTYDSEPVIDIPKLVYELRNGLVISF